MKYLPPLAVIAGLTVLAALGVIGGETVLAGLVGLATPFRYGVSGE